MQDRWYNSVGMVRRLYGLFIALLGSSLGYIIFYEICIMDRTTVSSGSGPFQIVVFIFFAMLFVTCATLFISIKLGHKRAEIAHNYKKLLKVIPLVLLLWPIFIFVLVPFSLAILLALIVDFYKSPKAGSELAAGQEVEKQIERMKSVSLAWGHRLAIYYPIAYLFLMVYISTLRMSDQHIPVDQGCVTISFFAALPQLIFLALPYMVPLKDGLRRYDFNACLAIYLATNFFPAAFFTVFFLWS